MQKNKLWRYVLDRKSFFAMCGVAFVVCALYAGVLAFRTFPPTEGWYSYYAYLINEEGAVPYLDFELLFPPLYTYIIALFTRVFGYGIIALRILGALVFATTGVFACLIFEKLTHNRLLGLVGGVLTVAILQCEIVQIFYDYIRFMDLCIYASVYFFLRYLDSVDLGEKGSPRFNGNVLAGAVFAVLASMFKQSSGLVFLMFCVAALLFFAVCLPRKKDLLLQTGVVISTAAVLYGIMFALLASKGAFTAYIKYNFVSSVYAKGGGSMFNIIFGWMIRFVRSLSGTRMLVLTAVVTVAILAIIGFIVWSIIYSKRNPEKRDGYAPAFEKWAKIIASCLLFASVIVPFLWAGAAAVLGKLTVSMMAAAIFVFCAVFFAVASFALIFKRKIPMRDWQRHYKFVFLSGTVFALGLAVGMSGGIAESQVALGYAFLPVLLVSLARYRKKEITAGVVCAAMLFMTCSAFARKVDNTYLWWGLGTGKFSEQTVMCDVPMLKGIKMTPEYAKMFNDVYEGVTENTEEGEEIFVFPHMPVLYLATDRPRATKTAVQWFDVSTDEAVLSDIDTIKEKKPKVIVICSVDDFVISEHEKSFRGGGQSGLGQMQVFLFDFVEDEDYRCLSENKISEGYTVSVWALDG